MTPRPDILLRARANTARRLIREGQLDPYLALALTVWPTTAIQQAEQQVSERTINFRAYSTQANA